jgi:hypothetical protein
MGDRGEPDRDTRDDDEALEEIRVLFARYRRLARHGMVTERVEPPDPPEPRDEESNDVPALTG